MDLNVYIQLIFLCVVNIIFAFSGLILNKLVIVSFLKSSQLRKKLCHFMIMVLSCSDLVAVITNHPGLMLFIIAWLREVVIYYSLGRRICILPERFLDFFLRTSRDKYRTISGSVLSNLSSHMCNQT